MTEKPDWLCRGILLAGAAAAAAIAAVLSFSALSGFGAVFCSGMILLFGLFGALVLVFRPLFQRCRFTICAAVGLYLCLCLRLCLFDYISPDYVSFLGPWVETMRGMTVREVLQTPIGDYNMPYLYLLLVISRTPIYDLYGIKLMSAAADIFLAFAAGRLVKFKTERDGVVLASFLGVLLAPTIFLNSGYWGQCDSLYAAAAIWALYCGLKKKPICAMVLFGAAFALKLQTIFLLPIVAFFLVKRDVCLRHLPAFLITFFVLMLPVLLAGRSISDTFGIYVSQAESYPYLSLNAPNFWSLIPNDYFAEFGSAAVLLAGIMVLLLLFFFLPRSRSFTTADLISAALLLSLAIPWLLPRMHERYFYLSEVLSIVYAAQYPRRFPVTLILLGGGFLAYCSYLFGGMRILSNELVAAVYGVMLVYLTVSLHKDVSVAHEK